jgi:hypothetical protein
VEIYLKRVGLIKQKRTLVDIYLNKVSSINDLQRYFSYRERIQIVQKTLRNLTDLH